MVAHPIDRTNRRRTHYVDGSRQSTVCQDAGCLAKARKKFGRGLTLAEKILSHTRIILIARAGTGQGDVGVRPDRVAMQDATAQMAVLQFMQANKKSSGAEHDSL